MRFHVMTIQLATLLMISLCSASNPSDAVARCLLQRGRHDGYKLQSLNAVCTPLLNQGGMYFTTKLCVGSPEQCFDVVADTGSNAVVVPSCVCDETPGTGCAKEAKCFRGTNISSSFEIPNEIKTVSMTFGSGTIQVIVATDVVQVGSLRVLMKEGVMLMVDRAALQLPGEFQGILGLGLPKDAAVMPYLVQGTGTAQGGAEQAASFPQPNHWWKYLCSWVPLLCDDPDNGKSPFSMPNPAPHWGRSGSVGRTYTEKLFIDEADVARFSMCFRDGNQSGALRLNLPPFEASLPNVGTFHWGLGLQGISIGEQGKAAPAEMLFCGHETLTHGMLSPCGIIPDSGTTLITGPSEQVLALEMSICSRWGRCQRYSQGKPSSEAFRHLLLDCGNWLTTEHGLQEIPSIFFHVKSGNGTQQVFELTAWAWVTERSMLDMGSGDLSGTTKQVCEPSLGHMEYHTKQNGPIWIFGTPLFYEYSVGYDMSTKQISLQRGPCDPCATESGAISLTDGGAMHLLPRAVQGEPRIPHYDTTMPL